MRLHYASTSAQGIVEMRLSVAVMAFIVTVISTERSMSEGFDQQQIKIINDTAVSICTTVSEAKGTKTVTQLQGEVRAEVGGVIGKLADVGATGKGSISNEEFEGLTQEATAEALKAALGCRERVFNKMFDKLSDSNVATSLHVAVEPDTTGIEPGGFSAVSYRFREDGGSSVIIETQDARWFLPNGNEVWEACVDCRILGGSFSVPQNGEYVFLDNVYLPPDLVQHMINIGARRVNLTTVFNGRDDNGAEVTTKAVLTIVPML